MSQEKGNPCEEFELRSCPSRLLVKELKKVVNSFADGLDKMDVVNATQSTFAAMLRRASTKEMALSRRA